MSKTSTTTAAIIGAAAGAGSMAMVPSEPEPLTVQAVPSITVRVDDEGQLRGSGFFILPNSPEVYLIKDQPIEMAIPVGGFPIRVDVTSKGATLPGQDGFLIPDGVYSATDDLGAILNATIDYDPNAPKDWIFYPEVPE